MHFFFQVVMPGRDFFVEGDWKCPSWSKSITEPWSLFLLLSSISSLTSEVSNEVFYMQIAREEFEFCRDISKPLQRCIYLLLRLESNWDIINSWYFPPRGQYAVLLKGKLRHTAREHGFLCRGADLGLSIPSKHCLLEWVVWTAEVGKLPLCNERNGKQQCFK